MKKRRGDGKKGGRPRRRLRIATDGGGKKLKVPGPRLDLKEERSDLRPGKEIGGSRRIMRRCGKKAEHTATIGPLSIYERRTGTALYREKRKGGRRD